MKIDEIRRIYPISWICMSSVFVKYLARIQDHTDEEFVVADFASGEHDRVPSFFIRIIPEIVTVSQTFSNSIYVYCIDVHALRLDSLLGKLEESRLLNRVRVVNAKLESMDEYASMRPAMIDYLEENTNELIWLDDFLIEENQFSSECFNIGVLNNDIIGYLMEYYTEYSDAIQALIKVHRLIKSDGLLIVTMPCHLYVVDNISLLRSIGFEYLEGIDIEISSGNATFIQPDQDPKTLSRLGHYTFMIFSAVK